MEKQFEKLDDGNSNAAFWLAFLTTFSPGQVEIFWRESNLHVAVDP